MRACFTLENRRGAGRWWRDVLENEPSHSDCEWIIEFSLREKRGTTSAGVLEGNGVSDA